MCLDCIFSGTFSSFGLAIAGCVLGFLFSSLFCWLFIKYGDRFIRSGVREFVTDLHAHKDKTPTMGGIPCFFACLCVLSLLGIVLLPHVYPVVAAFFFFGILGFLDDVRKIWYGRGISDRTKFVGQLIIASGLVTFLLINRLMGTTVVVPIFGTHILEIGFLFVFWAIFVIVATNNAVNITDGLDGLAGSVLIVNFFAFAVVALFVGNFELFALGLIMCGILGGFLWFNAHPAQLFMGDVGSLGFGGALVIMALLLKAEVLLPFTGIIFVVETLSSMLQIFVAKRYKKRFFKLAPFHHHLEMSGVPETRIVMRFFLVTVMSTLLILGLTLKFFC